MRYTHLSFVVAVFLISIYAARAQNAVAIGTNSPNPKAVLTLVGSNQGLIIPKVSNVTDIGTVTLAETGMIVFSTSDSKVYAFNGTTWNTVGGAGSGSTYTLSYDAATKIISLVSGSSGTPTINISATTLSGDLGGTLAAPTVTGIQGKAVSATAPTNNQVLQFNGTSWVPATLSSGSLPAAGPNQILTSDNTSAPKWASAIPGSQVTPNFATQSITTSGNIATTGTGNLTVAGTTTFGTKAYTWPSTALTAGTFLQTNASGTLSWVSIPGGGNMLASTYDPTNKSADAFDLTKHSGILALANGGTGIATAPTNGQLLIGNGTGYALSTLTPGTGINITNGAGTISISSTGLNNPMNAAGDIIYGGAGGTPTKLMAGTGFLKGGAIPTYSPVNIASTDITGTLPIANGGTGATTASQALANLGALNNPMNAPGDIIYGGSSGTPTKLMAGTGFLKGGAIPTYSPVNIASTDITGTLPIANGGTGATTAAAALSALGGVALSGDLGGTTASPKVAKLGGQAYSFPASNTTVGVLTNALGNGTLTWAPVSGFLTTGLPSGNIIVGNSAGVATQTAMGGDATMSSTGALTIATTSGNNIVNAINNAATTASITDSKLATISTPGKVDGGAITSGIIGGTTVISTSGDIVTTGGSLSVSGTTTFGGIKYTWPTTPLAAPTKYLSTDAAGNLNWATVPSPFSTLNMIPKGDGTTLIPSNITDNGTTVTFTSPSWDVANFTTTGSSDSRITFTQGGSTIGEVGYVAFNNTFGLSSLTSTDVAFGVSNFGTEVMRLKTSGNVGVGVTNPGNKLEANGNIVNSNPVQGSLGLTGDLPGYSTGTYPTLKTSGNNIYFSVAGKYSAYMGGTDTGLGLNSSALATNVYLNTNGNSYFTGGNVGIGTNSPTGLLDVNGSAFLRGFVGLGGATAAIGSSALVLLDDNGAAAYGGMYINSNATGKPFYGYALGGANVAWTYIDGNDANKWKLNYGLSTVMTVTSGGAVTATSFTSTSDLRLKENITSLNYGLREVLKLRPVSYSMKSDRSGKTHLGLIAQEALKVTPEIVEQPKNDKEFYSVNYIELIPVLIKAVQEQQKTIEDQNKQIEELKSQQSQKETTAQSEIIQLKSEIAKIKKALGMEASSRKK